MRTVLVAPSVTDVARARGGISFYRGIAAALAAAGPSTVHQLAPAPSPLDEPLTCAQVVAHPDAAGLVDEVAERLAPGDVVVQVLGALGVGEPDATLALASACRRRGAALAWFDPDAPARLVHLLGLAGFRRVARAVDAVLLSAGGSRAVEEYLAAGARRVVHLNPCIAALADTAAPGQPAGARDVDVLVPVAARSSRDSPALRLLEGWGRRGCIASAALVGGAGPQDGADGLPLRLRTLPLCPPSAMGALYRGARFSLNLLRHEFAGYTHTAAARLFESAAAGCCVVTEPFPGLETLLVPGAECLLVEDCRREGLPPEAARRRVADRAARRLARDVARARSHLRGVLEALALSRGHDRPPALPDVAPSAPLRAPGPVLVVERVSARVEDTLRDLGCHPRRCGLDGVPREAGQAAALVVAHRHKDAVDLRLRDAGQPREVWVDLTGADWSRSMRWIPWRDRVAPGSPVGDAWRI